MRLLTPSRDIITPRCPTCGRLRNPRRSLRTPRRRSPYWDRGVSMMNMGTAGAMLYDSDGKRKYNSDGSIAIDPGTGCPTCCGSLPPPACCGISCTPPPTMLVTWSGSVFCTSCVNSGGNIKMSTTTLDGSYCLAYDPGEIVDEALADCLPAEHGDAGCAWNGFTEDCFIQYYDTACTSVQDTGSMQIELFNFSDSNCSWWGITVFNAALGYLFAGCSLTNNLSCSGTSTSAIIESDGNWIGCGPDPTVPGFVDVTTTPGSFVVSVGGC